MELYAISGEDRRTGFDGGEMNKNAWLSRWLMSCMVCLLVLATLERVAAAERPSDAFSAPALIQPPREGWRTNGGSYYNQRFSPLTAIDRSNVAQLKGVWRTHLNGSGVGPQYSGAAQPLSLIHIFPARPVPPPGSAHQCQWRAPAAKALVVRAWVLPLSTRHRSRAQPESLPSACLCALHWLPSALPRPAVVSPPAWGGLSSRSLNSWQ